MVANSKKRSPGRTPGYEKFAITLPHGLAEEVRREAEAQHAPSLSAFFAEKMAEALEKDRLVEILDEMDAKYGPPGPEAIEWAKEVLYGE
ncbi:MAG: hypothetical protein HYX94_06855 [Chloroflexi bacterium]|nr:hypothetical protein [Chloroflexota bacterium]